MWYTHGVGHRRYRQTAIAAIVMASATLIAFACTQPIFNAASSETCAEAGDGCAPNNGQTDSETSGETTSETGAETDGGHTTGPMDAAGPALWRSCTTNAECGDSSLNCDDGVCSPDCTGEKANDCVRTNLTLCIDRGNGRASCAKPCLVNTDCQSGASCFSASDLGILFPTSKGVQAPIQVYNACASNAPFLDGAAGPGADCGAPEGSGSGCQAGLICDSRNGKCREICVRVDGGAGNIGCLKELCDVESRSGVRNYDIGLCPSH